MSLKQIYKVYMTGARRAQLAGIEARIRELEKLRDNSAMKWSVGSQHRLENFHAKQAVLRLKLGLKERENG